MVMELPLRRFARLVNGGTPTNDHLNWGGDVRWATPVDLARVDGGYVAETDRTLTAAGLLQGSATVPAGSVLVSTRAPIGYAAIATRTLAFNQGCKGLVPLRDVDGRFIRYWLTAQRLDLQAAGSGSTFMELGGDALMRFAVPAQASQEQRRIAAFLDDQVARIDNIIAARTLQIGSIEDLLWASFAADVLGASSVQVPLRRVVSFIADGPFGSAFSSADYAETGPAVIRLGNIGFAEFRGGDLVRIPRHIYDRFPRCHIKQGDLLIASLGDVRNHAGRACVAPDSLGAAMVKGKCFRAQVNQRRAAPHFVAYLLSSSLGIESLERFGRGATRTMLNIDVLMSAVLPIPELSDQVGIVRRFRLRAAETQDANELARQFIDRLSELKRSLITAAVTGEFDVSSADGSQLPI